MVQVEKVDCKDVNAAAGPADRRHLRRPTGREAVNAGSRARCEKATVEVTTGKDKGRTFTEIVQPDAPRQLQRGPGAWCVAYAPDAPRDLQYSVTDVDRDVPDGAAGRDLRARGRGWSGGCAA